MYLHKCILTVARHATFSHVNEKWHIRINHVIYERVRSHIMSHVTYESIMLHTHVAGNDSAPAHSVSSDTTRSVAPPSVSGLGSLRPSLLSVSVSFFQSEFLYMSGVCLSSPRASHSQSALYMKHYMIPGDVLALALNALESV